MYLYIYIYVCTGTLRIRRWQAHRSCESPVGRPRHFSPTRHARPRGDSKWLKSAPGKRSQGACCNSPHFALGFIAQESGVRDPATDTHLIPAIRRIHKKQSADEASATGPIAGETRPNCQPSQHDAERLMTLSACWNGQRPQIRFSGDRPEAFDSRRLGDCRKTLQSRALCRLHEPYMNPMCYRNRGRSGSSCWLTAPNRKRQALPSLQFSTEGCARLERH